AARARRGGVGCQLERRSPGLRSPRWRMRMSFCVLGGPRVSPGADRLRLGDSEEAPRAGYAFEFVFASVGEGDRGPGEEVDDRARDQDLTRVGERLDAGGHVHGHAGDVRSSQFDFADVYSGADSQTKLTRGISDRTRTLHPACGSVEGREETVAGRLDLTTSEPLELATQSRIMTVEQIAPTSLSKFGDAFS